jgi:hypothetical protein
MTTSTDRSEHDLSLPAAALATLAKLRGAEKDLRTRSQIALQRADRPSLLQISDPHLDIREANVLAAAADAIGVVLDGFDSTAGTVNGGFHRSSSSTERVYRVDRAASVLHTAASAAEAKHGRNSIESLTAHHSDWLAILTEEIGEVAHALTYDAHEEPGNLVHELIQVAVVAASWAQALDDEPGTPPDELDTDEGDED